MLTALCTLTLSWREEGGKQVYSPGSSGMLQQQGADASMGQCVPVDIVWHAMQQPEAEVEVQVQDIQSVGLRQPTAVEVGLYDVITQCGAQVAHLLWLNHGNMCYSQFINNFFLHYILTIFAVQNSVWSQL